MTRTVWLDFETRSLAPIKLVGGLNYVAHASTDVLCLCASDGVRRWVWSPFGLPSGALGFAAEVSTEPWALVEATAGATLVAHNAEGFDRPVWEVLFPGAPRAWADSLPLARRAQLPGKLEALGAYVLGEGKQESGRRVTLSLSKPIAMSAAAIDEAVAAARNALDPTAAPSMKGVPSLRLLLGPGPWHVNALRSLVASPPYGAEVLPTPSPAQLTEVIRYCMQDVELLRRVCEREALLSPHMDDDALEADRRVNSRGVAVDLALVDRLLARADAIVADAGRRAFAASDGAIGEAELRSTAKLRSWLAEQGLEVEDVKAETIKPALAAATAKARQIGMSAETQARAMTASVVLAARLDVARVATGKLKALKHRTSADGRLRGGHAYYQAHTGRWAGRGVQTQNLPSAVDGADPERVESATSEQVGSLVRQCFAGNPGLAVVDLAQVEARAACFLAGDSEALAVFTSGRDPYCVAASAMFGEPVKKGDPRRQAGKIAELACGFGGGPGAVERMAAKKGIDLAAAGADSSRIVEAWRSAHPAVAGELTGREWTDEQGRLRLRRRGGAWKAMEAAMKAAFSGSAPPNDALVAFERVDREVRMLLPSGRQLRYRGVEVGPFEDRREAISYFNPSKRKRVTTFGGRLFENLVQAYCRDLFADAFVRLEVAGWRVVLHEHDAWIVECAESDLPALVDLVRERPTWAADFPLDASGSWARRYAK